MAKVQTLGTKYTSCQAELESLMAEWENLHLQQAN
jgi:hypothetical protein